MERILCPFHKESTPSLVVYEDGYRCYGCGRSGPLKDLGKLDFVPAPKPPPEDIKAALARIAQLPLVSIRGLRLPADSTGYYITWPSGDYYKMRRFIGDGGNKYFNPRGHKKPLFVPYETNLSALAVVEGELNALSFAAVKPPFSVCSPGSATDFSDKWLSHELFRKHKRFLLVLDKDKPGIEAAKRMREALLKRTPYVMVHLMERDANELLQAGELQDEVEKMGV